MNAPADLLAILAAHNGRAQAIRVRDLAARLNLPERAVRRLVSEAREAGHAICAHPRDGYFLAATADELNETCAFLRSRAMHSLVIESRLRKVPLPELLGQMQLPIDAGIVKLIVNPQETTTR